MNEFTKKEIIIAAKEEYPHEMCGVLVNIKGKERFFKCNNLLKKEKHDVFLMDPMDYATYADKGDILAIVHSHPFSNAKPTDADKKGIESTNLPWIIVSPVTEQFTETKPSGYIMPLVGRTFVPGIVDCYALIRDYHKDTLKIDIPDYLRIDQWWKGEKDLYLDNFKDAGFKRVDKLEQHTVIFMKMASSKFNHGAIYLGDDIILHHVQNRLSTREPWGGYWRKVSCDFFVRHESLC